MTSHPEGARDPDEIAFNKEMSSARVQVKCVWHAEKLMEASKETL